ncbi:zinc-ribbon and DUF3426 domain-containing protein [Aquabacterium sp. CECT 9606]|uniref:zinc-ribbon and DUF3426 domain-containing protein n=1 Tax=Aquabacterium sp. CECT 9606 TaxID=2845822 RepID=UPI001E3E325F|nr:zinc-ribbon and DUF3426 domain-containing protein [Aquabacterium sp. CECT 9606]CAH0351692.1 hypothetical protein AQB9606_02357 [Aquabacterium sp. CECT 9606]
MSLATRCTHCGTIFKVVQDQLKVSEGWVRCGRCNEVFNALPGLFDLDRDPPPQRPASAPPRPPEPPAAFTPSTPDPVPDTQDSTWPSTSPAPHIEQNDFALDDNIAPHAAIDDLLSATDFELDTSVAMPGQPEPPPRSFESYAQQAEAPSPPEFLPSNLPVTDESDALDSRYLMPSETERPQRRRRRRGPDFADAEFPTDALGEIQDDWASDFGPSSTPYMDEPAPAPVAPPVAAPPSAVIAAKLGAPSEDDAPPSRLGEDFVPEQALKPPSQRKGRPGTRGRDPAAKTPEFLRRAQRRAFWRHPATRTVLSLISLALVATLALQAAHQFRNTLAAHYPEARPYLAQWCEAMDCKIEAPLGIDSLQVESATLVRTSSEGPDTYRLVVVVHNRASIGLAWPDIDLTLTDTNGAIVARRAFSPRDAQWVDSADAKADPEVAAGPLPVAAPADRSTTLQWRLQAPNLKLAGYTAELFYP